MHLGDAALEGNEHRGQAALDHAHVVVLGRRLSLGRARQRVGNHKGGARRQRHILRAHLIRHLTLSPQSPLIGLLELISRCK